MSTLVNTRYEIDSKLVSGYCRVNAVDTSIPQDIITECVKFFHIAMKWDKYNSDDWIVDEDQNIAELTGTVEEWAVIYSLPVFATGYHHWKLKIIDATARAMYVGITNIDNQLDDGVWNFGDLGHFYSWGNGDSPEFLHDKYQGIETELNYTTGDIISIIISNGKVSFKNENQADDIAEFNIEIEENKPYFMTVTCYVIGTKFKMLSYSSVPTL